MNVELLRHIEDKILTEPKKFNMNYFEHDGGCGTTYCIGGWARALSGKDSEEQALGLTEGQAERLFYVIYDPQENIGWPEQFHGVEDPWYPTPEQAIARIEHFIATNGRE